MRSSHATKCASGMCRACPQKLKPAKDVICGQNFEFPLQVTSSM